MDKLGHPTPSFGHPSPKKFLGRGVPFGSRPFALNVDIALGNAIRVTGYSSQTI